MTLNKVFALSIIALSLAACKTTRTYHNYYYNGASTQAAAGGNSATQPSAANDNGNTVAQPSNNGGNTATQPSDNSATATQPSDNSGNTATQLSDNSGNTAANNPQPRVDFSVSYQGLRNNANEDIQKLAQEIGGRGTTATLKSYKVTLGNQPSSGSDINLSGYPIKKLELNQAFQETAIARAEGNDYTVTRSGKAHIYRQNYSLIAGISPTNVTVRGPEVDKSENLNDTYILVKGQATQNLPTAGKFDYSGVASDGASQGTLAYSVDFGSRKGSGKITGIGSDINLSEASIQEARHTNEIDNTEINGYGIKGSSNKGDYELGFFGPNAEEIVGTVNNGEIGFAGSHSR
ncbi:factor H binding protein domain-containing protein [Neisseria blantyrii]|nr:factor H binding protein domain-containing protein [Neisseria blantyrii]